MQSVDSYFDYTYDLKKFNCLHFAAMVLSDFTGVKISNGVFDFLYGKFPLTEARKFKRLMKPESPCLVIFKILNEVHVGVFIRGKVLHLQQEGVQYLPLEIVSATFRETRFYKYV